MSDSSMTHEGMPSSEEMTHLLDSLRAKHYDIRQGTDVVEIVGPLGKGGSKIVYAALLGDQTFALALPNTVDGEQAMQKKWAPVLQEPENTQRIRALGIPTNTTCELMPLSVNGVLFPALRMARYEDLPFEVRDSKNRESSIFTTETLPAGPLDATTFRTLFQGAAEDIVTLVRNNVTLSIDSFNICLEEGRLRLYLNDLGTAKFEPIPPTSIPTVCRYYAIAAIDAFLNALSYDEQQAHADFFEGSDFSLGNPGNMYDVISAEIHNRVHSG